MRRSFATLRKELLILFRDKEGTLLLFLMPMVLIVVMALIQDAPFRDHQEKEIPLLYVDMDRDSLGVKLGRHLEASGVFRMERAEREADRKPEAVRKAVQEGTYRIAILVPEDGSERAKSLGELKSRELIGDSIDPEEADTSKVPITLYFDPVTKPALRTSILHFMDRFTAEYGSGILIRSVTQELGKRFPMLGLKEFDGGRKELFRLQKRGPSRDGTTPDLNSVQHNVPAWTVFGIFFIVLTMAGNMIRERNDGSAFRSKTLPYASLPSIAGKVGAYLGISLLQCSLMLLVGILLLPLFGLPPFKPGNDILGMGAVALATGFSATGSGVLVGTVFSTQQQASGFSAVAIVLLAALGGLWVPLYIMPEQLQSIGELSPLHWGLSAFNGVFIRDSGVIGVGNELLKLLGSGALMIALAQFIEKRRSH